MKTKKQMKQEVNWGEVAFKELQKAHQDKRFSGKTEKKKIKDMCMTKENIFMWIVISYGDFSLTFPLTEDEYKHYKKLELEFWK